MIQDCYAKSLVVSVKKLKVVRKRACMQKGRVAFMRFGYSVRVIYIMYYPHDLYFSAIFWVKNLGLPKPYKMLKLLYTNYLTYFT